MDRIYHVCVYVNADSSQKLIVKNEKFLAPTNRCFRKDASDTCSKIKTDAMTSCEKAVHLKISAIILRTKKKAILSFKICIFFYL